MRTYRNGTAQNGTTRRATAALAAALLAASCGGNDDNATPASGDDPESAYCDTARAWAVHGLDGDGDDQTDPAAFRAYWTDYLEFIETSREQAPAGLRELHVLNNEAIENTLTPVLEKYDFDVERIGSEGTAEEQALEEPPPEVQAAQAAIHAYESRVCGTGPGGAADVVFEDDGTAGDYCEAVAAFDSAWGEVPSSAFDPDVLRAFIESPDFTTSLDAQASSAPAAIAADVEALTDWLRTSVPAVLTDFDFDVRRLLLDGTPEDRARFQQTDPAIRDHHARVVAYDEQVCAE